MFSVGLLQVFMLSFSFIRWSFNPEISQPFHILWKIRVICRSLTPHEGLTMVCHWAQEPRSLLSSSSSPWWSSPPRPGPTSARSSAPSSKANTFQVRQILCTEKILFNYLLRYLDVLYAEDGEDSEELPYVPEVKSSNNNQLKRSIHSLKIGPIVFQQPWNHFPQ